VAYCYDPAGEEINWKRLSNNVVIDSVPQELVYYQTEQTTHLFVVRHPNTDQGEEITRNNWGYKRNMAVVEVLKQMLLVCNPRRFNLLKEFLSASNMLFARYQYLKGWDDTFCVKLKMEEGEKKIRPFRKNPDNPNVTSFNSDSKDLPHFAFSVKDDDPVSEVELNGLQITDVGEVITEGQTRLNGNVATTPLEHIVQILVPGVTDLEAISFKFEGWHTISVHVVLPFLLPKSKKNEQTTKENFTRMELCGGNSFFRHTFPESSPFHRPTTREELGSMISLSAGILTIHLQRELLDGEILRGL